MHTNQLLEDVAREGSGTETADACNQSILSMFEKLATQAPDRPILTSMNGPSPEEGERSWTRAEFARDIKATARLITQCGLDGDDRMAILLPNIPEFHLLLWGGIAVCAVAPINPLLQFEQIRHLISAMRARLIVCPSRTMHPGLWNLAQALKEEFPSLRVLPVGPDSEFSSLLSMARDEVREIPFRTTGGMAGLFHTGGTTGNPKITPLSLGNILNAARMLDAVLKCRDEDVFVNPLPLFHIAGAIVGGLAPLLAGAHVVMPPPMGLRDPKVVANFWHTLSYYKATMLAAVPTSFSALLDVPVNGADLSSLDFVLTGTAPLPSETARRFTEVTGKPIYTGYGMTETAGVIAFTPRNSGGRPSTVGNVLSPLAIRIAETTPNTDICSSELSPGQVGRILVRGPNVFGGYLNSTEASGTISVDGWFDTGDIGFLDGHGNLTLTGRTKDLIIRSGHNIDPGMIEEVALRHPAIAAAAAVGQIDAYAGEVPVLYVQLKASAKEGFDVDEFVGRINQDIAEPPARPRAIYVIDQIPLTAVGKIFKPPLRVQAAVSRLTDVLSGLKLTTDEVGLTVQAGEDGRLKVFVNAMTPLTTNQTESLQREFLSFPVELTFAGLPK